jgi:hypothetical protein
MPVNDFNSGEVARGDVATLLEYGDIEVPALCANVECSPLTQQFLEPLPATGMEAIGVSFFSFSRLLGRV